MIRLILFALVPLVATACVSSGTYDALQKQLDDTRTSLSGRIAGLEGEIKAKDQEIADARTKAGADADDIKRLEAEKARLESDKAKLESDLASTVKDRAALRSSAEELKEALAESNKRKAEADKRIAEMRQLLAQLRSMIDGGQLKV